MKTGVSKKKQQQLVRSECRQPSRRIRLEGNASSGADPGARKVLAPSLDAIELHHYLDKPADFLARMLTASRPFKPVLSDEDRKAITTIRRNAHLSPSAREDQAKILRTTALASQRAKWEAARGEVKQWVGLVQVYTTQRPAFHLLPNERVRTSAARTLEAEYRTGGRDRTLSRAKASTAAARVSGLAERKGRTVYRQQLKLDDRRKRAAFGWRQGRGSGDGWQPGMRSWINPPADGDWASEQSKAAVAHMELLALGSQRGPGFQLRSDPDHADATALMRKWSRVEEDRVTKREAKLALEEDRDAWLADREDELKPSRKKPLKRKQS